MKNSKQSMCEEQPLAGFRNATHEATAALRFWQALEYMAPQNAPEIKIDDCVWEHPDNEVEKNLPWNDPQKQKVLHNQIEAKKKRFQLYIGIVDSLSLIEAARLALGAKELNMEERKPVGEIACAVLGLDNTGRATGDVFISTVPWAMAKITGATENQRKYNFSGFFGSDGICEKLQNEIVELLTKRQIISRDNNNRDLCGVGSSPTEDWRNNVTSADTTRPVTAADVEAITDLVFERLGWRPAQLLPWRIQGLAAGKTDAMADDPLNSFYAEDIERIEREFVQGNAGTALNVYLRGEDSMDRVDVDHQASALIKGVTPNRFPLSAWPAKHRLVTAQQFAVNAIMDELNCKPGLFAVNGPPGTGKTTILKDIVAAVVVNRADELVKFKTPLDAFTTKIQLDDPKIKDENGLNSSLRGFGIIVASANNGAVENITKELPGLGAIDPELPVRYFEVVAETVAASEKDTRRPEEPTCWGMAAAVLGNKSNRSSFAERFWWAGMKPPANSAPTDGIKELTNNEPDPLRFRSLQELLKSSDHQALPWEEARKLYLLARKRVEDLTKENQLIVDTIAKRKSLIADCRKVQKNLEENTARLPVLRDVLIQANKTVDDCRVTADNVATKLTTLKAVTLARDKRDEAERLLKAALTTMPNGGVPAAEYEVERFKGVLDEIRETREKHDKKKPGFFSILFRLPHAKRWNKRDADLDEEEHLARSESLEAISKHKQAVKAAAALANARSDAEAAANTLVPLETAAATAGVNGADTVSSLSKLLQDSRNTLTQRLQVVNKAKAAFADAEALIRSLQSDVVRFNNEVAKSERLLDGYNISGDKLKKWDLADLDRNELHLLAPYSTPEWFDARRNLFIEAMRLHQSFITKAWPRLRGSLSAFINMLQGRLLARQVTPDVMHLWDIFFLVVPVVSTTFASFPRLFAGVGREQLAWLLIDEAGQATPQQAVGAIWRSKRVVVVGDPLQLEPIVGVPQEIVEPLRARCGAEPQWVPPKTSAQKLADRANRYGTYQGGENKDKATWLGAPLRVHRRCLDPMFKIANQIAYENKMVYGTGADNDVGIGESKWIHIPATQVDSHWIEEQGRSALSLVAQLTNGSLKNAEGQFIVYVVTPFRAVAEELRKRLYKQYGKKNAKGMSGTVHTFQGKEAEHVIFLLGGNPNRPGVVSFFAGAEPNLVNVAVTRAKRRLYVIGDYTYWTQNDKKGYFRVMAEALIGNSESVSFNCG